MKRCQKWSGNDEFWPKNEYRQISSSFGQHALNPFDTKPMAKIAVTGLVRQFCEKKKSKKNVKSR